MIRSIQHSPATEWISIQEEFEAVCRTLRRCDAIVRAARPIHYVRPSDRFLPVSLLRLTIDEILAMSFESLRASPGVGLVKIRNLAALLRRVAAAAGAGGAESPQPIQAADPVAVPAVVAESAAEAASGVTEVGWRQWCSRIALHGLESEPIGRLVDRLDDLPRSIWHTPLGRYCELTLEQLTELKSYGRRRVSAVTETFRHLNQLLAAAEACPGLTTTLGPELIASADAWAVDVILGRSRFVTPCYLSKVIAPLLVQIRHDVGDITYGVLLERFASRLPALAGLCGPVRRPGEIPFAERFSTSRLHQYRQDAAAIAAVRWPRGADLCRALLAKGAQEPGVEAMREMTEITVTLFPALRGGRSEVAPVGAAGSEADSSA